MLELLRPPVWSDHLTAAVLQPYPKKMGGVQLIAGAENEDLNSRGHHSILVKPKDSITDPSTWERGKSMTLGHAVPVLHSGTQASLGNTNFAEIIEEREKYEYLARRNIISIHEIGVFRQAMFLTGIRGFPQIFNPDPNSMTYTSFHAMNEPAHLEKFQVVRDANNLYKLTDVNFVNSKKMQDLYQGVFRAPFTIIQNPVRTDIFTPPDESEKSTSFGDINFGDGKVNILYLGRLEPRKGLDSALEVVNMLVKNEQYPKNFRFVVAGSGTDEEKLHRKVEDMGLAGFVRFVGEVSEEDKPCLYQLSDVCWFPAKHGESFGDVLLEAWASGKPTVAGMAFSDEIVKRGENGFLLPTDDVGSAANCLTYLINNPNERRNMGLEARKLSLQYDSKRIFDRKMDIINEVRQAKAKRVKKQSIPYYFSTTLECIVGAPSIANRFRKLKGNVLAQ